MIMGRLAGSPRPYARFREQTVVWVQLPRFRVHATGTSTTSGLRPAIVVGSRVAYTAGSPHGDGDGAHAVGRWPGRASLFRPIGTSAGGRAATRVYPSTSRIHDHRAPNPRAIALPVSWRGTGWARPGGSARVHVAQSSWRAGPVASLLHALERRRPHVNGARGRRRRRRHTNVCPHALGHCRIVSTPLYQLTLHQGGALV